MLDEKVAILRTLDGQPYCVSDLIQKLTLRSAKIVSLLRVMKKEGLIDFLETGNQQSRGRPKKISVVTTLGEKLLKDYKRCQRNVIQINENDIRSDIRQVRSKRLLEEKDISPYQRFFELSEIAFQIQNSVPS